MTKRVTITMNSTAEETIYTGIKRISDNKGQISLYDADDNLVAAVQKNQVTLQSTDEVGKDAA